MKIYRFDCEEFRTMDEAREAAEQYAEENFEAHINEDYAGCEVRGVWYDAYDILQALDCARCDDLLEEYKGECVDDIEEDINYTNREWVAYCDYLIKWGIQRKPSGDYNSDDLIDGWASPMKFEDWCEENTKEE